MSNPIRYDPLLTRALARELDARLHGARTSAIRLDPPTRALAIETERGVLVLDLHPTSGLVHVGAAPAAARVLRLRRRTLLRRVAAPPDERRLVFELAGAGQGGDRPREVVIELMTNQWNAVVLGDGQRILDVLWPRSAGDRTLVPGARYAPPPPSRRAGVDAPLTVDEWLALLGDVAPRDRARTLIERVAWTSPLNASAILGDAAEPAPSRETGRAALEAAYGRYLEVASGAGDAEGAFVLETTRGLQPYPVALPGSTARQTASLLDAFAEVAGTAFRALAGVAGPGTTPAISPELVRALHARIRKTRTRAERLESELAEAAPEAARLRALGTLLLSNKSHLRKGMDSITLSDFEGRPVEIELDPALDPVANAERYFDAARRRERAARSVPPLLAQARETVRTLEALLEAAERGDLDEPGLRAALEAAGVDIGVPDMSASGAPAKPGRVREEAPPPYRRYRTSGGLEVRVGRTGSANDELTFHHASPNDIWLHARDVAGAHVILRWPDRSANPPARDLREAAVLAALHSRARTSGVVPVDWTRRKYVRKPRNAPPGRVVVERLTTLFVEPDEEIERALRVQ